MGRRARIMYQAPDAWGDAWDIREERPTEYGWPILIGWPASLPRGRGTPSALQVVVTRPLRDHFEARRMCPGKMGLPLGRTAIKRIRRLLGHHWYDDRAAWWLERVPDLVALTYEEFGRQHGVGAAAACEAYTSLFGRRIREPGWWNAPAAVEILRSDMPRVLKADALQISVGAVGRLVWMIREES